MRDNPIDDDANSTTKKQKEITHDLHFIFFSPRAILSKLLRGNNMILALQLGRGQMENKALYMVVLNNSLLGRRT